MHVRNLYRYETDIGVVITPDAHAETDQPHGLRLIAEDGMAITNGNDIVSCVDVAQEAATQWHDCADPEAAAEEEEAL